MEIIPVFVMPEDASIISEFVAALHDLPDRGIQEDDDEDDWMVIYNGLPDTIGGCEALGDFNADFGISGSNIWAKRTYRHPSGPTFDITIPVAGPRQSVPSVRYYLPHRSNFVGWDGVACAHGWTDLLGATRNRLYVEMNAWLRLFDRREHLDVVDSDQNTLAMQFETLIEEAESEHPIDEEIDFRVMAEQED